MDFLGENFFILLEKTGQQIYLAISAILIAICIAIPAGILISRSKNFSHTLLSFANILQTIPSLALLALLLPILGIGVKSALVALSIYALLPITRNTATGILQIAPDVKEAAQALGFSAFQKLWMIELPLALPTIVAGIRIAMAMSIGIATLAAFIGAGGLGDFIYEGLSLNNMDLILLGAIPAALLALIFDYIIGCFEKFISSRKYKKLRFPRSKKMVFFIIPSAVFLFIFLAGLIVLRNNNSEDILRIGSKNFTEQYILSEMMAQVIENKTHLKVERKFNLGGTLFCHHALLRGDIDLYPEYTGTSYLVILGQHKKKSSDEIFKIVKSIYNTDFHLTWLLPFGFNNNQTLALRSDFQKNYSVTTLSDLAPGAKYLTLGVPADFLKRQDGFLGLKKYYNMDFKKVVLMDPNLMYEAIKNNQVDVIMSFATDGRIPAYSLKLLQDNKHIFPTYYAAPVMRQSVLTKHPEIALALQSLAGLLDNKIMQQLNYQVDVEKKSPQAVAREFLLSRKLIEQKPF